MQDASNGDECHYNLIGLNQKQARKIIMKVPLADFRICDDECEESVLTHEVAEELMLA